MNRPSACLPPLLAALVLAVLLAGCDKGPKSFAYGQDECAECRMTIVDRHYGAELITAKGKAFKFDDPNCLLAFRRRPEAGQDSRVYFVDFNRAGQFLLADQARLLEHGRLRSPMGSGIAAFSTDAELDTTRNTLGGGGRSLSWAEVAQRH